MLPPYLENGSYKGPCPLAYTLETLREALKIFKAAFLASYVLSTLLCDALREWLTDLENFELQTCNAAEGLPDPTPSFYVEKNLRQESKVPCPRSH